MQVGYGLDKDQRLPEPIQTGPGFPWNEPSAAEVEAAKKSPAPHLADGYPDLTGFWGGHALEEPSCIEHDYNHPVNDDRN